MGELTREEVTARIEAVAARIDARAQVTDSKIDALRNEMRALAQATDGKIETMKFSIESLQYKMEAKMHKSFVDLVKWMVGTAIAMMAVGVTVLLLLFNNFTPRQQAPIVITVPATSAPAAPR